MSAITDPTVLLLRSFCLATMAGYYEEVMRRAEKEGWSHCEVLRHLCESEAVERGQSMAALWSVGTTSWPWACRDVVTTHFLAALGRELILRHSKRVLFRPTLKLVGQSLASNRNLVTCRSVTASGGGESSKIWLYWLNIRFELIKRLCRLTPRRPFRSSASQEGGRKSGCLTLRRPEVL